MSTNTPAQKPYVKRSKDVTNITPAAPFLPFEELYERLVTSAPSVPKDLGTVSLIVERPCLNGRVIVPSAKLTVEGGMENTGWEEMPGRGPVDQICVMPTAAIRAISGGEDRNAWAAAGDQFFFDLDLSQQNFAVGDRVAIGPPGEHSPRDDPEAVVLEVTSKPHTGCIKFDRRYGPGALKVVSVPEGKRLRLRGIYFHVVRSGVVREGDIICKVGRDFGES